MTFSAVIYHHPGCSTSRNTLALIRHAGVDPEVIEYLQHPLSRDRIRELVARAGISLREALRTKEPEYAALAPELDDEAVLDAIERSPRLLNRPFVETDLGVRLCRPRSEIVLEILPAIATPFVKEDGEVVQPR